MQYTYRLARKEDFEGFLKIKSDPQNVKWSGFNSPPNKEKLFKWYISNLNNINRQIFLVWKDDVEIVGFFHLDKISDTIYEAASSGILTEFTNKGLGTMTLLRREKIAYNNGAELIQTWVSENNIASYRRLEK